MIQTHAKPDSIFLDVGCGSMKLRRYLPKGLFYNGIDISLAENILRRYSSKEINVALASATEIPLESEIVTIVACTEVLEHIPEVDKAISEIHRILTAGGFLFLSIPNNYCYKYKKKGPHADHVNDWTFDEFRLLMEESGFDFLTGTKVGFWIPFPSWLTHTSYQLPRSHQHEFYNTNFFYAFRKAT